MKDTSRFRPFHYLSFASRSRRNSARKSHNHGIELIDSLLDPDSITYEVLSANQIIGLNKLKSTLQKYCYADENEYYDPTTTTATIISSPSNTISTRSNSSRSSSSSSSSFNPRVAIKQTESSGMVLIPKKLLESSTAANNYLLSEFYGLNEDEQRYRRRSVKENWDAVRDIVTGRSFRLNSSNEFEKSTPPLDEIEESKELEEEDDEKSIEEKVRANRTTTAAATTVNNTRNTNNNSNNATAAAPSEWYELDPENQIELAKELSWNNLMNWDFDIFKVSKLCNNKPMLFVGWAILASPHSQRIMKQTTTATVSYDNKNDDKNQQQMIPDQKKRKKNRRQSITGEFNNDGGVVVNPLENNDNEDNEDNENNEGEGYDFIKEYNIPPECLFNFLRIIGDNYISTNPFHNELHAADVLQTTHSFLEQMNAKELPGVQKLHYFSLLIAAAVHDVGHPGYNNNFQSNASTKLAITYNDKSILENYHTSLAFRLILWSDKKKRKKIQSDSSNNSSNDITTTTTNCSNDDVGDDDEFNIFQNMDPKQYQDCRQMIIQAVMGTDLASHFIKMGIMKDMPPSSSWDITDNNNTATTTNNKSKDYKRLSWEILSFMMHVADISNNAKIRPVAVQWTDRILEEFFLQGDKELEMKLPISPLCDRRCTSRPESQLGFIEFIIKPSFKVLSKQLPQITTQIMPIIEKNYQFWQEESEKEKKKDEKQQPLSSK